MKSIIYPDGEEVEYIYNAGGSLMGVYGDVSYIDNISYNKFGSRTKVSKGNGFEEEFVYDNMQRLESKKLKDLQNNVHLQNIHYLCFAMMGCASGLQNKFFTPLNLHHQFRRNREYHLSGE